MMLITMRSIDGTAVLKPVDRAAIFLVFNPLRAT
jgi:hypothetical protein